MLHTVQYMQGMHEMHSAATSAGMVLPKLLSAQQVQLLLHVDRSTIYRMADDGRLPAIKVGKQWRFPRESIEALLAEGAAPVAGAVDGRASVTTLDVVPVRVSDSADAPGVPAEIAAAVGQVAAELLGVMMVITDMDGHPVAPVANPCPWFADRLGDPGLLDTCVAEWRQLADDPAFEPRFRTGPMGFECARVFIRSGTSLVGMVLAGGVAPAGIEDPTLYHLDDEHRRQVLTALPRVAAALSRTDRREPRERDAR